MAEYTPAFVTVKNKTLFQATSVTVTHNPALLKQATLALGLAGMADGAAEMEVRVDNAVPAADFEFDPTQELKRGMKVPVGVVAAGRQIQQDMWITNIEFSRAVNSEPRLSISFVGPFKEWE